jgi:hypothetical protein
VTGDGCVALASLPVALAPGSGDGWALTDSKPGEIRKLYWDLFDNRGRVRLSGSDGRTRQRYASFRLLRWPRT